MKKLLFLAFVMLFAIASPLQASIPMSKSTEVEQNEGENALLEDSKSLDLQDELTTEDIVEIAEAMASEDDLSSSEKEMLILVLLWFFLGALAGHRWYAKKPVGWNILFILTAGGCGIWAIVDLVNILTGKF